MTAIAGLRGTGQWAAGEQPQDYRETILWLNPNGETPLQGLLSKMGSDKTTDPQFHWYEELQGHVRLRVNGAIADGVPTTIVVDTDVRNGAFAAVAGDIYVVETAGGILTGEQLMIVTDPTSDVSIEVIRGFAGSTATVIPDDTYLLKIGNAFEEGTGAPKATTRNPDKLTNFTQIFKTTYDITKTAEVTKLRTGDPVANDKKRKLFDVNRDMEMAMIYGRASESPGPKGKMRRTTAGLLAHLTTNRTSFGGGGTPWTEDNLIDFFASVFNYDGQGAGNQRLAFCGNTALTAMNKLARNSASTRINFDKAITNVYGMSFSRWILPQGEIFLKTHPLFNIHPEIRKVLRSVHCVN